MELLTAVKGGLSGALETYAGRLRQLAEGLSDEQFWTRPYPYGNSFGHLVLHVTGNLNGYIGAQLAGTGYVRNREREFTEAFKPSKKDVLEAFDHTVEMVSGVLGTQTSENLGTVPSKTEGTHFSDHSRLGVFFHCVSHLNHHVGQMIYLEKELHRTVR